MKDSDTANCISGKGALAGTGKIFSRSILLTRQGSAERVLHYLSCRLPSNWKRRDSGSLEFPAASDCCPGWSFRCPPTHLVTKVITRRRRLKSSVWQDLKSERDQIVSRAIQRKKLISRTRLRPRPALKF